MYFEIWMLIALFSLFVLALYNLSNKYYDMGYVDGSVEAHLPTTDEYVAKVIAMLEHEGVIKTEKMENGDLRILPGDGKKKGA